MTNEIKPAILEVVCAGMSSREVAFQSPVLACFWNHTICAGFCNYEIIACSGEKTEVNDHLEYGSMMRAKNEKLVWMHEQSHNRATAGALRFALLFAAASFTALLGSW
ncbi:hypothetical protein K469DRAFT_683689 [Zopfia rhizophila CBS 207.26]|uniref:Uncharacterized protein n=1 Tax=Zopfia rhizophila CBS 207.26 TaxID=1314779 RepID=A0A6A6EBN3_9PEZI|nr:hypothetical protein K469DRAFT_683689 [Zopfia rhizophila CBS 207.26]